jgi:hypothetical protein
VPFYDLATILRWESLASLTAGSLWRAVADEIQQEAR